MTNNPYDVFDDAPQPAPAGPAAAPQDEQAVGAREAREAAGRVPRRRAEPPERAPEPRPPTEGENPYDQFDGDPKDNGIALMERLRLNRQDAFYRGSIAGSARLAVLAGTYQSEDGPNTTPEMKKINQGMRDEYTKIVADLAAYDGLKPWGTTMEATAALGGQLEGTLISPESWVGWGAKGATWLGRTARAGLQQSAIQAAADPAVQALDIAGGVQREYDPARTAIAAVTGLGIGAGAHVLGEGLGRIVGQRQLRKQMTDLARQDVAFQDARQAVWALDPANDIHPEGTQGGERTGEFPAPAEGVPHSEMAASHERAALSVKPAEAATEADRISRDSYATIERLPDEVVNEFQEAISRARQGPAGRASESGNVAEAGDGREPVVAGEGGRAQLLEVGSGGGGLETESAPAEQFLAQRRQGGKLAGEIDREAISRSPDATPEQDISVRSLQQQAMDLAEALDFPLREGRVGSRTAAGVFHPRTGVVRVREVPDFDVVSHEAGHALEAKVGKDLTDLTKVHAIELRPLDYDQGPGGRRVEEGFAEFARLMLTNPAYAEKRVPTFAAEFRSFMSARDPAMLEKLDAAARGYKAYLEAPSVDAVGSVRRSVEENPRGIAKVAAAIKEDGLPSVIKAVLQKSYDGVMDDKAPVARAVRELGMAIRARTGAAVDLRAADNPEVLMRLLSRARQGATRDLMDGVRPYHDIAPEGPSLANAISEAIGSPSVWGKWDEGKRADFDTYLIARRAEYLWRKFAAGEIPNPPVSFSSADAKMAMADLERDLPNLRNASDMVHGYTRELLRKSYDGGLIDADLYQRLAEEEFYVPFMRDMSDKPGAGSGTGSGGEGPGTTQIVRRLRGSSRDIKSPLESIMAQTFLVNRTLRHNDVIKAFVELADRAGSEGGKYVEPIPAHESRKYTADLEQAIESRAKEIGMDPSEAQNILAALGDPEGGAITGSYFKMEQAAAKGEPIVFYREGGALKAARFMSDKEGHALYELLTAAPETVSDLWMQMVGAAASLKRAGIVTNPTFAITNYFRDQLAVSILRSDYAPFASGLKGISDEFRQGQNAVLYGYAGGVAGGASTGPVEKAFETEVDALAKKGYLVNRVTSMKGLLELASFTEAGTRNSVFDAVFQASRRKGLSDYEAMVEAAFQAQDILDFSRHGSGTVRIRSLLPFLNAHIQGLDKARRVMIDPIVNRMKDGEVFTKDSAEYNNALLAWTKAGAAGGALGAVWAAVNWDSEAYRDANPYFKGTHLVVPFGNKVLVLPKPFELGLGFTAGEYAYHALAGKDPRAARMFGEAAWQVLQPPNPFTDVPLVSTSIEMTLGKSLFTGKDIVPEQYQRLPAPQQFNDRTSNLAKWLGKQTGLSPMKIEYGIGSEFGTWGRDVMALSQGVDENTPAAAMDDAVFFRRFVKDPTRSSDVTTRFWDFMSRTTGRFNQDVAGYDALVRDAATRGLPLDSAKEFLSKLPAAERSFVTLKSAATDSGKAVFTADERKLHPLQHAYDAVEMLNGLRKEISTNSQMSFGGRERINLNPVQRRDLLENVRELAQMEMRNGLVIMGEAGYQDRPVLDPNDTMDKIRAISPVVGDEIATRYATAKIYSTDTIRRAWPQLRDQLVRSGSEADIRGLAADARGDGYQFQGVRVKRPGPIRRPIEPGR